MFSTINTSRYITLRWLLLSIAVVSGAGLWTWHDYRVTLAAAATQQTNVARLLETHTVHVISNASNLLERVLDEVRDHDIMGKGAEQHWPYLSKMAETLPVSGRLWIYRADGSAVMASHLRHSDNNAADREYFTAQKTPGIGLFIGETVIGKTTGKRVFNISRRIEAPDGSFAGVAMAAIDIDVFIQAVSELDLGAAAAYTLARADGAIIMRHPDAGATGKRFNLNILDQIATQRSGLMTVTSAIDGVVRQIAYRTPPKFPLAVVVSLGRDEILAPWRERTLLLAASLALLLGVTTWLTVIARRATRRESAVLTRMQVLLDTVAEGICGIDANNRIAFINPAGASLLGYATAELVGKPLHETTHHSHPDGSPYPADECPLHELLKAGTTQSGTDHFWRKEGQGFAVEYSASRVDDLDGHPGVVMAFRDVTARLAAEREMERLAQTDSLTGLANRRHFMALAEVELSRTLRYGGELSVLMIDIDHFKTVNDTHGHPTGDQVLQMLGRIFIDSFRTIDIVGRLGGEEFAAVLPQTGCAQAVEVAERLRQTIQASTVPLAEGLPLHFTVSIGVATLTDTTTNLDTLLAYSDDALYAAKDGGRNRVCVQDGKQPLTPNSA